MKEYRLKELLPLNEIEIAEDCDIVFSYQLKRGFYAQKGDAIGKIAKREYIGKNFDIQLKETEYQLIAPDTAVYDFTVLIGVFGPIWGIPYKTIIDDDFVFCKSYKDFQEEAVDIIKNYCQYVISDDIFNTGKVIVWNHYIPTLRPGTKSGGEFVKREFNSMVNPLRTLLRLPVRGLRSAC